MVQSSDLRRWLCGACAAVLILSPAMAQQAPGPASTGVTTVSPLTVTGLPKVGEGASLFTSEELAGVAAQAQDSYQEARDATRNCFGVSSLSGPLPEDVGQFGVGALSASESRAQYGLQQAALAARAATEAALAASTGAARGEVSQADLVKAELARQAATKAFQDAQKAANEAHYRTLDLLELADQYVAGDVTHLRALEKGRYVTDCPYNADGDLLIVPPPDGVPTIVIQGQKAEARVYLRCIEESNFQTMREVQAQVDSRAFLRSQNGGSRLMYVPAEYADLRLTKIVAGLVEEKGVKVIRVSGKIVNPRRTAIPVPMLWVEIIDQFGTSLKAEQIVPPSGLARIPTRDSMTFTYAVSPAPERMAKASVTFAPSHRQTAYLTAAMACTGQVPIPDR